MTSESDPRAKGWLYLLAHSWHKQEKLRFLLVGVGNTLLGYLIFVGTYLVLRKHLHYLGILVLAHLLSVLCAFMGHKFLTFRVKGHLVADFLRFNLSYLGALSFGMVGLPFLVEVCRIRPLVSQAVLIGLTTIGSYFLHKRVSFRRT